MKGTKRDQRIAVAWMALDTIAEADYSGELNYVFDGYLEIREDGLEIPRRIISEAKMIEELQAFVDELRGIHEEKASMERKIPAPRRGEPRRRKSFLQ